MRKGTGKLTGFADPLQTGDVLNIKRFLLVAAGVVGLTFGFMLLLLGGFLLLFNVAAIDSGWYLTSDVFHLKTDERSYAIVADPDQVKIDLAGRLARRLSRGRLDPLQIVDQQIRNSSYTITVTRKYDSKETFIGIAPKSDVGEYLSGVRRTIVDKLDLNPLDRHPSRIVAGGHRGKNRPEAPSSVSFWKDSTSGTGDQTLTLTWSSEPSMIVLMNADGSPGIDVDVVVGVEVPSVFRPALATLAGVLAMLFSGIMMVYVRRRTNG